MKLSESKKALIIMLEHHKAIVDPLLPGVDDVDVDKMNDQLDDTLKYHGRLRDSVYEIVLVRVEKIYKPKSRKVFELRETRE